MLDWIDDRLAWMDHISDRGLLAIIAGGGVILATVMALAIPLPKQRQPCVQHPVKGKTVCARQTAKTR